MVSFLRPWLFLFIIILGEMLLTEIRITIKKHSRTIQNTKTDLTIQMFFFWRRKQLNHKGSKREHFQGRCVSYFPPPFIKNNLVHFKCFKFFIGV